jgi:alpha-D-ribose 1-methylphosphonate 5-phosphate C-P lyase
MDFDIDDQINTQHLLFLERTCRICGETKSLIDDFYLTRKGRGAFPSAYAYECKECTKRRVISNRKGTLKVVEWEYPDW